MTATLIKRKVENGVFVETGRKTVKNLGWLFKHASEVTELHFDRFTHRAFDVDWHEWQLRAIMMNGDIYVTKYNSPSVFADVFNRNRTLRTVAVFSNFADTQACGELYYN